MSFSDNGDGDDDDDDNDDDDNDDDDDEDDIIQRLNGFMMTRNFSTYLFFPLMILQSIEMTEP